MPSTHPSTEVPQAVLLEGIFKKKEQRSDPPESTAHAPFLNSDSFETFETIQ